jgi:hypothetical protein
MSGRVTFRRTEGTCDQLEITWRRWSMPSLAGELSALLMPFAPRILYHWRRSALGLARRLSTGYTHACGAQGSLGRLAGV